MTEQKTMIKKLTGSASKIAAAYSAGADRPLVGYITAMGTYSAVVAGLAAAAAASGHEAPPRGLSPYEVVLLAAATHKISLLITKDPVTSPLRAPFTTYDGTSGLAELSEKARGHGARKTFGELVSCPTCAGMWVGTGLTAGLVFAPKVTRLVMSMFAALAGADLMQFGHALLEKSTS